MSVERVEGFNTFGFDVKAPMRFKDLKFAYIGYVLAFCNDNKTQAAEILGVDRRTLYRWVEHINKKKAA